jgi:hypothetical protein
MLGHNLSLFRVHVVDSGAAEVAGHKDRAD